MRRPAVPDPNVMVPTLTTAYDFEGFQGSYASLYATLGLYVLSFPGLWSTIKRATKVALVQNTYEFPGENAPGGGRPMREIAGDVMAYMQANNYEVADAGETITFRGQDRGLEVPEAPSCRCHTSMPRFFGISPPDPVPSGRQLLVRFMFAWTVCRRYLGQRPGKMKIGSSRGKTHSERRGDGDAHGFTRRQRVRRMEREMALQQRGMVRVKGVFPEDGGA